MRTFFPLLALSAGCFEADAPRDVTGNFEVLYADNLRVFIDGTLVAEVELGEEEAIEWDGETFTVSQACGEEDIACPSESGWRSVALDQPWGPEYTLLNFVNLDTERGEPGQRMGGTLDSDGAIAMLSGLGVAGQNGCAALAVGAIEGSLDEGSASIPDGVLAYEWAGGCQIGEATIAASFRLETDLVATRTGGYDVSSVTPEEPIDEKGEVVDPEEPEGE